MINGNANTEPLRRTVTVVPRSMQMVMPKLKNVAAYARVSTEQESQEGSYELQCQHYTDYIKSHKDWNFVKVYADEGKTGTSTKAREGFMQMIKDCEAGKIDMIITKSISRFARNTVDCLETIRKLKNLDRKVSVYFEKENIDTLDAKSELLLTILSSLAQDESRSISENIRWSLQKKYESGYVNCPTAFLLGYKTQIDHATGEKKTVVDETEAPTVRQIYNDFLQGCSYSEIAHRLEDQGLKTARGLTTWTSAAVFRILTNEKYVGDVISQKMFSVDFLNRKRIDNQGQVPMYKCENHHEAIINRGDWVKVQELIENGAGKERGASISQSSRKRSHSSKRTVFSGILTCGYCGANLLRRSVTSHGGPQIGKRISIWKCRNSEGRGDQACSAKAISELTLQQTFMAMLLKLSKKTDAELEEDFRKANNIELEGVSSEEAARIGIEIERINMKLELLEGDPKPNQVLLDDLEKQKKELEARTSPKINWNSVNKRKKEAFKWFQSQLKAIKPYNPEVTTIEFRPDIFSKCIEKGEVMEIRDPNGKLEDIIIRYTFTFGGEVLSYGNKRGTKKAKIIQRNLERG